jgi:hypothetical protein
MNEVKWQLPVKQSHVTQHDWIHPKMKYHAFINDKSICGKYGQDTSYFETDLHEPLRKDIACNQCLKKLKLF